MLKICKIYEDSWGFGLNTFNLVLKRVTLELTVCDYDRIGTSDPIGKVSLGYNRKGAELKHWKEMVENPRRPVIHWHVLKVKKKSPALRLYIPSMIFEQILPKYMPIFAHVTSMMWANIGWILPIFCPTNFALAINVFCNVW